MQLITATDLLRNMKCTALVQARYAFGTQNYQCMPINSVIVALSYTTPKRIGSIWLQDLQFAITFNAYLCKVYNSGLPHWRSSSEITCYSAHPPLSMKSPVSHFCNTPLCSFQTYRGPGIFRFSPVAASSYQLWKASRVNVWSQWPRRNTCSLCFVLSSSRRWQD